jgi:hypothetical protein
MAIEFVCPYCDAQIRVPDKAAGKSGKCPRCVRKLMVPRVSAAMPAVTAAPPPPQAPGLPDFGAVVAPSASAPADDEIVFADAAPVVLPPPAPPAVDLTALPQVSTSVARKLKKRRRSLVWMIPVFFGLLLCGGLAFFYFPELMPARVTGELTAARMTFPDLEPALIDKSLLGGTEEDAKSVLADLESQPIPLISSLMQVQLRGTSRGLNVFVTAGADTMFYRVDLTGNPSLQTWLQKHAADLEDVRERQLARAGKSFVPVTRGVQSGQTMIADLVGYRDTLALPALAGGLGYHVVARNKTQLYPCVYQQADQALYFLLPPGLTEFQIEGRAVSGSKVSFPAKLTVRVSPDEVTVGPRKSEPKADAANPAAEDTPKTDDEPSQDMQDKTDPKSERTDTKASEKSES